MSISLAATWGAILLGIFSCAAVAPSFASSDQLTRASATKKAEPTPYWAAPNGLSYDLRSIFHEVLRFRVRGDPRRRVEVTLGGSLPCTPRTNPRRVAACVHDVDGHAAVLGLKADFRFEEMENPEGFRLWYEHKAHSFTLDFFCSDAEFPTDLDYLDRIADPEITGFAASYFGRITSVVGCGFVLPDPSGHPHKDDGPALTWRAHGGGQGFRFSSQTVLEGQLLVELEPPHGLDAIEISLGSPTPCTGVDTETVAICFYPHAEPPVAAGYHSSLQLRRAHHGGVDIHVQGGRCSPTRNYRTHIVVKCQGLGEASSLWAWRSTNGGCDLIIEMVSPFGCGVETHAKPPARHAPRLSIATNHHNEVGDGTAHEDNVAFQPDVNSFGCIEGNCKTGTGTYKWRTGSTYIGEWKDGARHGQGLHEWPDGRRYSGEWNDNVRCGQGTHRFANHDKYTGSWVRDRKHGEGSYVWSSGGSYNGTFTDDRLSGEGERNWPNGDRYSGTFRNGLQHGYGAMTWSNGTKWVGVWVDGRTTDDGMTLCTSGLLRFRGRCVAKCADGFVSLHGQCFRQRDDL